jgi:3-methyl-2-oxobutanoate hydroxymethyltransferase
MTMATNEASPVVTRLDFVRWKAEKRPISMITAYDFPSAKLFDEAGADCLLVGDSLGVVVQGHDTTLPVTMEQMLYHAEMVARAARRAFVVSDLPFMTYQASKEQAILSAGRMLKETGVSAVKLEGGRKIAETVRAVVDSGIPVMGHIGLTPQAVRALGGFKVQREGDAILDDARALEDAGAFAVVIECVPVEVARSVTEAVGIPTIGIGAGPHCDGQVLVNHDMLGLFEAFRPRFVRHYAELSAIIREAVASYVEDVRSRKFPTLDESFR